MIWDNCKLYNIAESEIYRMAEDLERTSKKMVQKLKATLGLSASHKKRTREDEPAKSDEEEDDDDEDAEITFDDRIKFTDNVRKLTIEQMTELVKKIQEECPSVLDDLDSDKLQIKVDDIDKVSFEKLMDFTKQWLNKDVKAKNGTEDENSKSNNDDGDENMGVSQHTPERSSRRGDDEESKHEGSIDASKYGPEGKRIKTS